MSHGRNRHLLALAGLIAALCVTTTARAERPFAIRVVDQATSRGIPQVILETALGTRHVTDSNGYVAYHDPLTLGKKLFLKPTSDGYRYDAPGLAMGGVVVEPAPGTSATIVMQRDMIAERLYRMTGAGIYRDSMALGLPVPIENPMINASVIGQDSTLCTVFQGRLFWIWGDTSHMRHPLAANFGATAAFSDLPTSGGLAPDVGVNYEYIEKDGFTKPMIARQPGHKTGVYWLSCLATVPDAQGRERVIAWASNIDGPTMKTLVRQIVEFDPDAREFQVVTDHSTTSTLQPGGHAVTVTTDDGDYLLFTGSHGQLRVRKTYESATDPAQYEAFTCLANDDPYSSVTAEIRRDADGRVVYGWRRGATPVGPMELQELVDAGKLRADECIIRPVDAATGKPFRPHGCSIAYNAYRDCWTMITSELGGTSMLGEAWYLEAPRPEGPWINAVKVLTHKNYTFYNPLQHPEFSAPDAPHLYFEGTYTKMFSGNEVPTPYYDYNQVMYRLDLDDPRLAPEILASPSGNYVIE